MDRSNGSGLVKVSCPGHGWLELSGSGVDTSRRDPSVWVHRQRERESQTVEGTGCGSCTISELLPAVEACARLAGEWGGVRGRVWIAGTARAKAQRCRPLGGEPGSGVR